MKPLLAVFGLFALSRSAVAHVAELPLSQHALEHGWFALLPIALLPFLLPRWRGRRR